MTFDTVPLRRLARFAYGESLPSSDRSNGAVPVMSSGGVTGSHCASNALSPAIIIGRKGSHGSLYWTDADPFVIDTAYYVDRRHSDCDLRWLYYVLQTADLPSVSADVGVPGLSRERAYEVRVVSPPTFAEQRRIADFLDDQVTRIDQVIHLRKQHINLLEERFRSLVTEHVTRAKVGNDLGAGMEGGSIDWKCAPLRRLVFVDTRGSGAIKGTVSSEAREGLFPGYSASGQDVWLPPEQAPYSADGLVISAVGARCGKVFHAHGRWGVVANTTVLTPRPGVDARFAWYILNNEDFWVRGVTAQPYVQMEPSLSKSVPHPPLELQKQIAGFLDDQNATNNALIAAEERQITLLQERKRALITAAVTGEFDVSSASARATAVAMEGVEYNG